MPGYHRFRLPEPYKTLTDLSASGFAWEWLRRNPHFRATWDGASEDVRQMAARALVASRRVTHSTTTLSAHPLERRTAPWGLTFLAGA